MPVRVYSRRPRRDGIQEMKTFTISFKNRCARGCPGRPSQAAADMIIDMLKLWCFAALFLHLSEGLAGKKPSLAYIPMINMCADRNRLMRAIDQVRSPGQFCVGGRISMPSPHLQIADAGVVSFPLQEFQTNALKQVAKQAPFGKGSETLVDLAVRDSLQFDAAQTVFANPTWESAVQKLADEVGLGLGIEIGKVRAQLDKVLLYGPGGHFKPHQDSEKAPGMFGSLVLQFPCLYEGGAFYVRHSGLDRTFEMDKENGHEYSYVAFYADCEHEIKPIITGHRMTATYCLCWKDDGAPSSAPSMKAARLLSEELKQMDDECFAIILKHTYTSSSISEYGWKALKGFDRSLAGTLQAAMTMAAKEDSSFKMSTYICEMHLERNPFDGVDEDWGIANVHMFDGKNLELTPSLESLLTSDADYLNWEDSDDWGSESESDLDDISGDQEDPDDKMAFEGNDSAAESWRKREDMWFLAKEGGYTGNEATFKEYSCFMLAFHRGKCIAQKH